MSRIGKKPVKIEDGVEVKVNKEGLHIKGPKGSLTCLVESGVQVSVEDGYVQFSCESSDKSVRAKFGLYRALLANMMVGVTKGFQKELELAGVGYRVQLQGVDLLFSLGFSHPVKVSPPTGISFSVDGQNKLLISGIDKQLVGQTASNIRNLKSPDPYKQKGIRFVGQKLRKKQGKSVKK